MRTSARLLFVMLMASVTTTAAEGLRNPFWPKGYVGEMTPISAEVRPKPKPKPKPQLPKIDAKAVEAANAAKEAAAKKEVEAKEAAARAAAKEAAAKEAAAKVATEKAAQEAAAKAKAEAERKREISREDWKRAMKSLKIGNPAVITTQDGKTRSTISINDNIYGDGDLMSVTHEGIRFTWRIKGLAGGEKLKLERLRARRIQ